MSTSTGQIITASEPDVSSREKFGFLFGHPIAHSLSPLMHQTVYDSIGYNWQQFSLPSTDMSQFLDLMRRPDFYAYELASILERPSLIQPGASVTMPHKVAILPHLDEMTDECRSVGACNTIFIRQDGDQRRYVGTNTDVIGIREAFAQNVPRETFHGKPALVVGGGGAARSAVYALKVFMKATTVYMVNRDKSEVDAVMSWYKDHGYGDSLIHIATVEQAKSIESIGAIVSCVPDFAPSTPAEVEARGVFEFALSNSKGAILEMCYHPRPWTQIAELAERAGWSVILGTEAMIYQGFAQDTFWTGKPLAELPVEEVKAVIARKLEKSRS